MKQHEAVIEVMRAQGGYATLGKLYELALRVPGVEWKTRTPFASIRRIVQDPRFFFKIRPGLWALNEYRDRIPFQPELPRRGKAPDEFSHSYYQGLLVEIGNLKHLETYVPLQDKNRMFLDRSLKDLASLSQFYPFTYAPLVERARTIDVTWFNSRKLPDSFFEVEHSTDIYNSLLKFVELQDFNSQFRIVAHPARRREFEAKVKLSAFREIAERVRFLIYETVSELHARTYALHLVERRL